MNVTPIRTATRTTDRGFHAHAPDLPAHPTGRDRGQRTPIHTGDPS